MCSGDSLPVLRNHAGLPVYLLLSVGKKHQVISKIKVLQQCTECPLDVFLSLRCGCLHDTVYGQPKAKGDGSHPCLTPVSTWKALMMVAMYHPAGHPLTGVPDDLHGTHGVWTVSKGSACPHCRMPCHSQLRKVSSIFATVSNDVLWSGQCGITLCEKPACQPS